MSSHGGPDARGVPLHDFSTNGNGCGPCPAAVAALQQADAARYPDPDYQALRQRLAAWHGVAASRIVLAASASEFIFRITAAAARHGAAAVGLPPHSYGDYERAASAWGLRVVRAREGNATAPGLAARQLLWCCDPASPTGQAQPTLGAWVDAAAATDMRCVLDLAYEPLRLQGALGLSPAQRDGLWQLWTPNKALGLTGVRAAYAIAPLHTQDGDALRATLVQLAPSWPVGGHGVALLSAWCTPAVQQWLDASRETLREWKAQQVALCASLGWTCLPSDANFICARTDAPLAEREAALRRAGIKLRDCASFGLPGHVRLGVLPPASQQALGRAWRAARGAILAGRPTET